MLLLISSDCPGFTNFCTKIITNVTWGMSPCPWEIWRLYCFLLRIQASEIISCSFQSFLEGNHISIRCLIIGVKTWIIIRVFSFSICMSVLIISAGFSFHHNSIAVLYKSLDNVFRLCPRMISQWIYRDSILLLSWASTVISCSPSTNSSWGFFIWFLVLSA